MAEIRRLFEGENERGLELKFWTPNLEPFLWLGLVLS